MKWEYKTIKLPTEGLWSAGALDESALDAAMNEIGDDGWELVSAFSTNKGFGESRDVVVMFKRPK